MMGHGSNMESLAHALNLTDAQKAQVQPIMAEEYKKMRALHSDTSLSPDDRRAKMKEIRDETSAQLQSILTPEQYAKWQSRMHSHHTRTQTPNVSTNAPAGSAQ
jgi:Spy/CpxP family protein refolding chaperone